VTAASEHATVVDTATLIKQDPVEAQPHILILDDQHAIRSMFKEVLNANHYRVSLAKNLEEAVKLLKTEVFHAIFVDIFLNEKESGLDLLPSVRQIHPHTPVIVISGMASMDNVMDALKSGAYDMLCKPFNIVDMLHVVARAVEKKGLADENERLVAALKKERDSLENRVQEATSNLENTIGKLRMINEQIATMFEISQIPPGSNSSSSVMIDQIFDLTRRIFDFDEAFCVVYDTRAGGISLAYSVGELGKGMMKNMVELFRLDHQSLSDLADSEKSLPIEMFQAAISELYPDTWPSQKVILMPLHVHKNLIGVVGLIGRQPDNPDLTGLTRGEERILGLSISHLLAGLEQRNYITRTGQLAGMGELIAEIAHDLRNPMTSLRGSSRMLIDGWQDDNKRSRCLDEIKSNLARMESMVSELVNFYDPKEMNIVSIDVHKLLNKSIELTQSLLEQKKINVARGFDPADNLMIMGLTQNLIEALVNLISNACHAMDEGGTLRLSTSVQLPEGQRIQLEEKGRQASSYMMITIEDDGCGIDEENLDRIFRRFFTTRPDGHGLGLAAVQRILKKNLGHISVESKKGGGTTFYLFLPRA
jgi:signal transduction histidine kinase/DNA-binding response OmpR family regulator